MKILLVSSSYLPRIGGLEIFVSNLGQSLLRDSHLIRVITQRYPRTLREREFINGIEINRYLFFDPKPPLFRLRSIGAYLYTLLLMPFNLLRFVSLIKRFNPDVINYHFVGAPTLFILIYLNFFKKRLVVSLHGSDVRELPFESKISMALFRRILERADFITANSSYILDKAIEITPFIKDKSKVIYNGINFEEFNKIEPYRNRNRYVLSIGRLEYTKGIDLLIEAFNFLLKETGDIDLIIAGEGSQKRYLEELIKKLNLESRIKFYGWAGRAEVAKLIKGCEFLILPSRDEAFGIAILEAMACKKAVIATDSGGPEEIISNGINGLLVSKEDPHSLAEGITGLLRDTGMRERLSRNTEATVKKFDMRIAASQYEDIFRRCT